MIIISFIIIDYALITYACEFAKEKVANSIIREDTEDVFYLNLEQYKILSADTADNMIQLLNQIGSIEGMLGAGIYWEDSIVCAESEYYPVVVISENLCDLCNVEGLTTELFKQQKGTNYIGIVAGYELGKQYPVGTIFSDENSEYTYIVTKVLPKNSKWIDSDMENGLYYNLDNHFLVGAKKYFNESTLYLMNGLNNFCYYISNDADEKNIKEQVERCADNLDINIYSIHSLKQLAQWNQEVLGLGDDELRLSVFLMFSAIFAMLTASLITIYVRKKDIGILYTNGYSKKDIMYMYCIENTLKIIIAFATALGYWSVQQYHYFAWSISIIRFLIPWSVCVAVLFVLFGSLVPILQILKLQPVDLIEKSSI